ncbi:hypothetical protein IV203_016753 [Nitzschia inconspicua]|uniref:Uncharacterized protein n=1 Tax=Nitzschia inconspicua TaxID=303405 RepID=A0A9K3KS10_9STRA|nr:hypothetical protein IV203_016753 [Nitzschia inconspicua]
MTDYGDNKIDYANMIASYENAEDGGDESDEYIEDSSGDGGEGSYEKMEGDSETYQQETDAGSDNDTNEFESTESKDNVEVMSDTTQDCLHDEGKNAQVEDYKNGEGQDPDDDLMDNSDHYGSGSDGSNSNSTRDTNSSGISLDKEGKSKLSSENETSDGDDTDSGNFADEFEPKDEKKKRGKNQQSPESSDASGTRSGSESDDDFEDEIVDKKKKNAKRKMSLKRSRAEDSPLDQERGVISQKLSMEREGNVTTRERIFTRWIIAISILVCLGAGALVTLYFLESFGGMKSTSAQANGNTTTAPTVQPSVSPTTIGPTSLGPDVVATFSFFGLVTEEEGATSESVEENLIKTLNQLAPEILAAISEGQSAETRGANSIVRRRLKAVFVKLPVSANVEEVECPSQFLIDERNLCLEIDVAITLATDNGTVQRRYLNEVENAISSGLLEDTYSEVNQGSTILFFAEEIPPTF